MLPRGATHVLVYDGEVRPATIVEAAGGARMD